MKTIGLLGGMSWVSTTHYYELINRDVADRLGGDHCAPMVLWQADFAAITELQRTGQWSAAGELLADGAATLVAAGADVIGICANTMHLVADAVVAASGDSVVVHIVDVVAAECRRRDITAVGLLGTAYTMESPDLYPPRLAASGIGVVVPPSPDRDDVQRITFDELVHDIVTEESAATFRRVGAGLVDAGADGVVLACTEHGELLRDGDLTVPVLDSTRLHALALVAAAMD